MKSYCPRIKKNCLLGHFWVERMAQVFEQYLDLLQLLLRKGRHRRKPWYSTGGRGGGSNGSGGGMSRDVTQAAVLQSQLEKAKQEQKLGSVPELQQAETGATEAGRGGGSELSLQFGWRLASVVLSKPIVHIFSQGLTSR